MESLFPENGKISALEHQYDTKGTCKYERLLKSKQGSPWYSCTPRDQTLTSKCSRTDHVFLQGPSGYRLMLIYFFQLKGYSTESPSGIYTGEQNKFPCISYYS